MKIDSFEGMLINKLLVYSGELKKFQNFYMKEASNILAL